MLKKVLSFLIKLALVGIGTAGIISTYISAGFMSGNTTLLYFTIQSNITIITITFVFLINSLLVLLGKKSFINQPLLYIKFCFTVAITLTFIVFVTLLAPIVGLNYFLSFNNFSLHIIVPILAILDFFLFDYEIKITKKTFLIGTFMPIYYFIFYLIGRTRGFKYIDGADAPYFFLDYTKYGWFTISKDGLGVFYWVVILIVFVALIGILYSFLMHLRQKNRDL